LEQLHKAGPPESSPAAWDERPERSVQMLQDLIAADRIAQLRREAERERLAHQLPAAARVRHRYQLHLPAVLRHPVRTSSRTV
jgi:hypothetical protein